MDVQPYAGALEAVDRILNREPEADEVLRQTVVAVRERIDRYTAVSLLLTEDGALVPGPSSGQAADGARTLEAPVVYDGQTIGSLVVSTDDPDGFVPEDGQFLERVALVISSHCLVGWDTGGVPWSAGS